MENTPRQFQFSLRTLLELIAVAAVCLALLYGRFGSLEWYRVITEPQANYSVPYVLMYDSQTGRCWELQRGFGVRNPRSDAQASQVAITSQQSSALSARLNQILKEFDTMTVVWSRLSSHSWTYIASCVWPTKFCTFSPPSPRSIRSLTEEGGCESR